MNCFSKKEKKRVIYEPSSRCTVSSEEPKFIIDLLGRSDF